MPESLAAAIGRCLGERPGRPLQRRRRAGHRARTIRAQGGEPGGRASRRNRPVIRPPDAPPRCAGPVADDPIVRGHAPRDAGEARRRARHLRSDGARRAKPGLRRRGPPRSGSSGTIILGVLQASEDIDPSRPRKTTARELSGEFGECVRSGGPIATAWHPVAWHRELLGIIAGRGGTTGLRDVVRRSTRDSVGRIHRVIVRMLTPDTLTSRSATLFSSFFEGSLSAHPQGNGVTRIEWKGCVGFDRNCWLAQIHTVEEMVAMSGARAPSALRDPRRRERRSRHDARDRLEVGDDAPASSRLPVPLSPLIPAAPGRFVDLVVNDDGNGHLRRTTPAEMLGTVGTPSSSGSCSRPSRLNQQPLTSRPPRIIPRQPAIVSRSLRIHRGQIQVRGVTSGIDGCSFWIRRLRSSNSSLLVMNRKSTADDSENVRDEFMAASFSIQKEQFPIPSRAADDRKSLADAILR